MTCRRYAANREKEAHHWSARLPLPPLFDVVLVHKGLSKADAPCVVSEFLVEEVRCIYRGRM